MDLHERKLMIFPLKKQRLVKKGKKGYILEADVEYPEELHKNHKELPISADRMKTRKVKKLISNLKDKKMYVVHIKRLNQALNNGLKLKKNKRNWVIRFEQSYRMKFYIMLNTRSRTHAKNEFEKDFLSS